MAITGAASRVVGVVLLCLGIGSSVLSGASDGEVGHRDRLSTLSRIQVDRSAGQIVVGDAAIEVEPRVWRELRDAQRIARQDRDARGLRHAAGRLSRQSRDTLDAIGSALERTGVAPQPPPREGGPCLDLLIGPAFAGDPDALDCAALSGGPSGPLCSVWLALLTQDAVELEECVRWHSRFPSRPADADGDGVGDTLDECPFDPEKSRVGWCGCGVADRDEDENGVPDCLDVGPRDLLESGGGRSRAVRR